ncbi:MAG: tyrosine-type recombinase/integrase [Planctomycetaceae bacterium]
MSKTTRKPKKPYPDYPLTAHRNGYWCKKIRRRIHYFGAVGDPEAARKEYLRVRDDLQAGRTPTTKGVVVTLASIINAYLEDAENRCNAGELSPLSFRDYWWSGEQMAAHFGRTVDPEKLTPADFAGLRHSLAARDAPGRLAKTVTVTRMIFRWAYETELLNTLPKFGPGFRSTSKRAARAAKAEAGGKLFTRDEIRRMLDRADGSFRAAILTAINTGMGNTDLSQLTVAAVDLDGGWINFPRPKTGVNRRIPLWRETVDALRETIASRPEPKGGRLSDRVFLTSRGSELVAVTDDGRRVDKLTIRFRHLLEDIRAARKGRGFYSLRHTFQTAADDAGDPLATPHVMGHVDSSTAGHYRERIADDVTVHRAKR